MIHTCNTHTADIHIHYPHCYTHTHTTDIHPSPLTSLHTPIHTTTPYVTEPRTHANACSVPPPHSTHPPHLLTIIHLCQTETVVPVHRSSTAMASIACRDGGRGKKKAKTVSAQCSPTVVLPGARCTKHQACNIHRTMLLLHLLCWNRWNRCRACGFPDHPEHDCEYNDITAIIILMLFPAWPLSLFRRPGRPSRPDAAAGYIPGPTLDSRPQARRHWQ